MLRANLSSRILASFLALVLSLPSSAIALREEQEEEGSPTLAKLVTALTAPSAPTVVSPQPARTNPLPPAADAEEGTAGSVAVEWTMTYPMHGMPSTVFSREIGKFYRQTNGAVSVWLKNDRSGRIRPREPLDFLALGLDKGQKVTVEVEGKLPEKGLRQVADLMVGLLAGIKGVDRFVSSQETKRAWDELADAFDKGLAQFLEDFQAVRSSGEPAAGAEERLKRELVDVTLAAASLPVTQQDDQIKQQDKRYSDIQNPQAEFHFPGSPLAIQQQGKYDQPDVQPQTDHKRPDLEVLPKNAPQHKPSKDGVAGIDRNPQKRVPLLGGKPHGLSPRRKFTTSSPSGQSIPIPAAGAEEGMGANGRGVPAVASGNLDRSAGPQRLETRQMLHTPAKSPPQTPPLGFNPPDSYDGRRVQQQTDYEDPRSERAANKGPYDQSGENNRSRVRGQSGQILAPLGAQPRRPAQSVSSFPISVKSAGIILSQNIIGINKNQAAGLEETAAEMVVRLGRSSAPITRGQVEALRFLILKESGEAKRESLENPSYVSGENSSERLFDLLQWMNAPPEDRLGGTPEDPPTFEMLMHPYERGELDPNEPVAHAAFVAWAMGNFPIFYGGNHRTGWALMNVLLLREGVVQRPIVWKTDMEDQYYKTLNRLNLPLFVDLIKRYPPPAAGAEEGALSDLRRLMGELRRSVQDEGGDFAGSVREVLAAYGEDRRQRREAGPGISAGDLLYLVIGERGLDSLPDPALTRRYFESPSASENLRVLPLVVRAVQEMRQASGTVPAFPLAVDLHLELDLSHPEGWTALPSGEAEALIARVLEVVRSYAPPAAGAEEGMPVDEALRKMARLAHEDPDMDSFVFVLGGMQGAVERPIPRPFNPLSGAQLFRGNVQQVGSYSDPQAPRVTVRDDGRGRIVIEPAPPVIPDWILPVPAGAEEMGRAQAVREFRVEQKGEVKLDAGFYLEGEGALAFAPVLALLEAREVLNIESFAGVVETAQDKQRLLAVVESDPGAAELIRERIYAVEEQTGQDRQARYERAQELAENHLRGFITLVRVRTREDDLLVQLNRLLSVFGYRLPEDPAVQRAARTLLQAA